MFSFSLALNTNNCPGLNYITEPATVSVPPQYGTNLQCVWNLQPTAPSTLYFDSVSLQICYNCGCDFVQLSNDATKYCNSLPSPRYLTANDSLTLSFRSNNGGTSGSGFTAFLEGMALFQNRFSFSICVCVCVYGLSTSNYSHIGSYTYTYPHKKLRV